MWPLLQPAHDVALRPLPLTSPHAEPSQHEVLFVGCGETRGSARIERHPIRASSAVWHPVQGSDCMHVATVVC